MLYIAGGSISLTTLFIASLLGIGAGALLCLLLRKPWDPGIALLDALLAPTIAFAFAVIVLELDRFGSAPFSPDPLILPVAVLSVAVRHFIRLTD